MFLPFAPWDTIEPESWSSPFETSHRPDCDWCSAPIQGHLIWWWRQGQKIADTVGGNTICVVHCPRKRIAVFTRFDFVKKKGTATSNGTRYTASPTRDCQMLQQNLKTNLGIIKSNLDWHKLIAIFVPSKASSRMVSPRLSRVKKHMSTLNPWIFTYTYLRTPEFRYVSQMLHVWNIYLHLGNFLGKCR